MLSREYTESQEAYITQQIARRYTNALASMQEDLKAFLADFDERNRRKRTQMLSGVLEEEEYRKWLEEYPERLEGLQDLVNGMSLRLTNTAVEAEEAINERAEGIFLEALSVVALSVITKIGEGASEERPKIGDIADKGKKKAVGMPRASVKVVKEYLYNNRNFRRAIYQGMKKGESMQAIANRLYAAGMKSEVSAIRMARTVVIGAEGAGALEALYRLRDYGLKVKKQWYATHDGRTRETHRNQHGEIRELEEEFTNGCQFPGDPRAMAAEKYNCRCTLVGVFDGESDG